MCDRSLVLWQGACKRALLLEASDGDLEKRLLAPASDGSPSELQPESARRRIRTFKNQVHKAESKQPPGI